VAGLYWQRTTVGVAAANRVKLVEWAALSVAAPVIVLVGPGAEDPARRDKLVVTLREMLTRAGFNGDEAPVVCAERPTPAMLESLAIALDERADQRASEASGERVARIIEHLERVVEEGRDDAAAPALAKAARVYARARVAERERITRCALTCATRPGSWGPAMDVLNGLGVALPRRELERVIEAMLDAKAKLPTGFARALDLWARGQGEDEGVLFARLARVAREAPPSSERALRAGSWLRSHASPAQRAELRAMADELTRRPAQRAHVLWCAGDGPARPKTGRPGRG
jgi:hypothetical protein